MLCPTAYACYIKVAWLEEGMACMVYGSSNADGMLWQPYAVATFFKAVSPMCVSHTHGRLCAHGRSEAILCVGHEDYKPLLGHKRISCAPQTPGKPWLAKGSWSSQALAQKGTNPLQRAHRLEPPSPSTRHLQASTHLGVSLRLQVGKPHTWAAAAMMEARCFA